MSATALPALTPRKERLAKQLASAPDHAAAVAEIVAEIDEADLAYETQMAR
jgi:hypothetical protein